MHNTKTGERESAPCMTPFMYNDQNIFFTQILWLTAHDTTF